MRRYLATLFSLCAASAHAQISAPVLKWAYGGCSPSSCQTGWYGAPAVANLDADPAPEVVYGSADVVALSGASGALEWRAASGQRVWSSVAVADLDGDGAVEIVAGRNANELTVYRANGTPLFSVNPFANGEVRTVALRDLERDGDLEIVVARASGGDFVQMSVYEHTGSVRPGWPARRVGEAGFGWGMYNQNVALGDLDNDGFSEVYGPTDTHYITALERNGDQLRASAIYGTPGGQPKVWAAVGVHVDQAADLTGFANCGVQHRPNFANAAPAVADMDGNGTLELIVPGDVYNCAVGDPAGDLYYLPWIFKRDRTRWSGAGFDWTVLPPPGLSTGPTIQGQFATIENAVVNAVPADLDGDGQKEILMQSYDGKLHAWWLDKTEKHSWPYIVPGTGFRFGAEPAVADLDGDGKAEVVFTSWPEKGGNALGKLIILNFRGELLHAVDLPTPRGGDWNGGLAAPTLANIDADADLEIVIGTSRSGAVAYDLGATPNAKLLWATARGSNLRNGEAPRLTDNFLRDGFE